MNLQLAYLDKLNNGKEIAKTEDARHMLSANKLSLEDISSSGNCCKTKCTSLFQKYLNTSPMVYLNRYRLEKSVFLLRNTTMSVTEIAYACGFSNSSYFCELFISIIIQRRASFARLLDKVASNAKVCKRTCH